jgi:hypothetical protein
MDPTENDHHNLTNTDDKDKETNVTEEMEPTDKTPAQRSQPPNWETH